FRLGEKGHEVLPPGSLPAARHWPRTARLTSVARQPIIAVNMTGASAPLGVRVGSHLCPPLSHNGQSSQPGNTPNSVSENAAGNSVLSRLTRRRSQLEFGQMTRNSL